MKTLNVLSLALLLLFVSYSTAEDNVASYLQDISVTIIAPGQHSSSQGSGNIITRQVKDKDGKDISVNFVWTAGHVIDGLRSTRTVIKNGTSKTVIEFKPAYLVKELIYNGRRVGEIKMEIKVIKFSDSENGEDLALLMVRQPGYVKSTSKFYLADKLPLIGAKLFHVGSLMGQFGSNSMTDGIVSKVGRVLDLGQSNGVVFDQTTVTAFPGSSGGGVYFAEGKHAGEYVGMLVRGAGETFNLIVPIRRMKEWAAKHNVMWALDPSVKMPSLKEINGLPVESTSKKDDKGSEVKSHEEKIKIWNSQEFRPLIIELFTRKP